MSRVLGASRRAVLLGALVVLLAAVVVLRFDLVGRALGDGGFERAAAWIPADASLVAYVDSRRTAERVGLDVERGRYEDTRGERAAAQTSTPWVVPLPARALLGYESAMDGGAWSALDVAWSASVRGGGASYTLVGLHDVDTGAVADELVEHGYAEDDVDGHRSFRLAEYGAAGGYPLFDRVTFLDDDVLVIGDPARAVAVGDGDVPALADDGSALLDDLDDVELVRWSRGSDCAEAVVGLVREEGDGVAGEVRMLVGEPAVDAAAADRRALLAPAPEGAGGAAALGLDDVAVTTDDDLVVATFATDRETALLAAVDEQRAAACSPAGLG